MKLILYFEFMLYPGWDSTRDLGVAKQPAASDEKFGTMAETEKRIAKYHDSEKLKEEKEKCAAKYHDLEKLKVEKDMIQKTESGRGEMCCQISWFRKTENVLYHGSEILRTILDIDAENIYHIMIQKNWRQFWLAENTCYIYAMSSTIDWVPFWRWTVGEIISSIEN